MDLRPCFIVYLPLRRLQTDLFQGAHTREVVGRYQITLGGSSSEKASIGSILGPGFAGHEVADAIEKILDTYLKLREPQEEFLAAYRRLGAKPFKEALYAAA